MAWPDAVRPARGGVALDVEVVPGASRARFPAGYNAWRGRFEARVHAPPEGGQANAELCALVAEALAVEPARVRVASGLTSRRKTLVVDGLLRAAAVERLAGRMAVGEKL